MLAEALDLKAAATAKLNPLPNPPGKPKKAPPPKPAAAGGRDDPRGGPAASKKRRVILQLAGVGKEITEALVLDERDGMLSPRPSPHMPSSRAVARVSLLRRACAAHICPLCPPLVCAVDFGQLIRVMAAFQATGTAGKQLRMTVEKTVSYIRDAIRIDGFNVGVISFTDVGFAKRERKRQKHFFEPIPTSTWWDMHVMDAVPLNDGNSYDGLVLRLTITPTKDESVPFLCLLSLADAPRAPRAAPHQHQGQGYLAPPLSSPDPRLISASRYRRVSRSLLPCT